MILTFKSTPIPTLLYEAGIEYDRFKSVPYFRQDLAHPSLQGKRFIIDPKLLEFPEFFEGEVSNWFR